MMQARLKGQHGFVGAKKEGFLSVLLQQLLQHRITRWVQAELPMLCALQDCNVHQLAKGHDTQI